MTDPKRYEEFADLIELSTRRVLAYLHALLLNWNDAEDVFQETCLVLWQKFDEFRPGTSFLAWALRIAQHKAMNFQQKQTRYIAFTARLRDALMMEFADRSAEEAAGSLAGLSVCMDELPQNDQRLVKLCYVEDVPVRQLAAAMDRSPESIHNSLLRIRNCLLDCIRHRLRQADTPALIDRGVLKEEIER
jgi:RNA polymerase sigma-70 factor, ECF subfamily